MYREELDMYKEELDTLECESISIIKDINNIIDDICSSLRPILLEPQNTIGQPTPQKSELVSALGHTKDMLLEIKNSISI